MRVLNREETVARLGVSPLSVGDKRFRARAGLVATKVGKCLRFREEDVEQVLRRGRERLQEEIVHAHA